MKKILASSLIACVWAPLSVYASCPAVADLKIDDSSGSPQVVTPEGVSVDSTEFITVVSSSSPIQWESSGFRSNWEQGPSFIVVPATPILCAYRVGLKVSPDDRPANRFVLRIENSVNHYYTLSGSSWSSKKVSEESPAWEYVCNDANPVLCTFEATSGFDYR